VFIYSFSSELKNGSKFEDLYFVMGKTQGSSSVQGCLKDGIIVSLLI
jgi:hypothetical protein